MLPGKNLEPTREQGVEHAGPFRLPDFSHVLLGGELLSIWALPPEIKTEPLQATLVSPQR